ncbi:MAG: hypothetical protein HZC24_07685 [Rhodocyclales bacterium]|nr:hypothetical protein [Rhodocyclales bacterium]
MTDDFLDLAGWQAMLAREPGPLPDDCIAILRRADFAARRGTLLTWSAGRAELRAFEGDGGMAVLLVADAEAIAALRSRGIESIPALVRQGKLHPYILKTMDQLEDAGAMDFVEDVGLVFPKH